MVDISPFVDDVRAVAAHHGVPEADAMPVPTQGEVNLTVFLGEDLVLRLPRTSAAAHKLAKEAEVIPLVVSAGVPTAELIGYDPSLRIASVPYMVLRRVRGSTMAEQAADPETRRRTLGSLGEVLVALHRVRRSGIGPLSVIPEPYSFSPSEIVDRLIEAGEIGSAQRDWLLERFALLQPDGAPSADPVLLHRDVIPSNVIVDGVGRVAALLDWGSAEWGSPARDLVGLPIRDLPDLLSGYRSALGVARSGSDGSDGLGLERDALRFHLHLALERLLKEPSTSEDRNWAAPRSATLLDLLAFTSDAAVDSWSERLRRAR